jgi:hypothetical protein
MNLNLAKLTRDMTASFVGSLKKQAPAIEHYAAGEAAKMAQTLVTIEKLKLAGIIDEDEAKLHLDIQRNATRSVFLAVQGLGLLAVEQAINAALAVVRNTVNTSLGFALI